MKPDNYTQDKLDLSRRASIVSDIVGYILAVAIISVMFALSGSFF